MRKQIAQGDILLVPVRKVPLKATLVPLDERGVVLAEGEVTGFAHIMSPEKVKQWDVDGQRYVEVMEPDAVRHVGPGVGHGQSEPAAPGAYRVVRPQEYDYSTGFRRPVID